MIIGILLSAFVILAVIIIVKFLHHLLKATFLVVGLFAILIIIFGIFVLMDAKDIKDNLGSSPSRLAYEKDGKILVMVRIDPARMNASESEENENALPAGMTVFSKSEIARMDLKDLESLRGDDYKLLIFNDSYFDALDIKNIDFQGQNVGLSLVRAIIRSDDPIKMYASEILNIKSPSHQDDLKENMLKLEPNAEESVRSIVFLLIFSEAMKPGNLPALFKGVRSGEVKIYPETAVIEVFKITPVGMVKFLVNKMNLEYQQAKDDELAPVPV